ncbi:MAG: hypothetical protein JNL96_09625 [Planctomycetaceae bacterium]|nr:hypothetical protein [Planctomycetaceae bacterium]
MLASFAQLDRILRGELTRPASLATGRFQFSITGVSLVGIVLAMVYGACMGAFSVLRVLDVADAEPNYMQLLASTLKTPALFFLTLVITMPSLYVFNALVGSQLVFTSVLRLLIAALGVNLAVLASLGPIVAFFSLSTNSYGFMVLLNVAVFAVAGFLGLMFLMHTLNRLHYAQYAARRAEQLSAPAAVEHEADSAEEPAAGEAPPRRRPLPGPIEKIEGYIFGIHVKAVFAIWIVVFGLVGAQMGWILRPFIGAPGEEFTWLRKRESNFFQAVATTTFETLFGVPPATPPAGPGERGRDARGR